jgi:hypothetical protein
MCYLNISFNSARHNRLELKPMTSYQRLIVHRVAHYFKLDHVVVDSQNPSDDALNKRKMVLYKSQETRV